MNSCERLTKNAGAIRALAVADNTIRKAMISNASKELILTLVQCAQDIIKGQVTLTTHQLGRLKPYEQLLERFIASKVGTENKKQLLQRGGFLGALVRPLVAVLPQLLQSLGKRQRRRRR